MNRCVFISFAWVHHIDIASEFSSKELLCFYSSWEQTNRTLALESILRWSSSLNLAQEGRGIGGCLRWRTSLRTQILRHGGSFVFYSTRESKGAWILVREAKARSEKKSGQATAENEDKHRRGLSQMEIADEGPAFSKRCRSCPFSSGQVI